MVASGGASSQAAGTAMVTGCRTGSIRSTTAAERTSSSISPRRRLGMSPFRHRARASSGHQATGTGTGTSMSGRPAGGSRHVLAIASCRNAGSDTRITVGNAGGTRPAAGTAMGMGCPNRFDPNPNRAQGSGDRDHDGIPNRFDPNPNRAQGSGDRDHDGIPNRFDPNPNRAQGSGDRDHDGIPNRLDPNPNRAKGSGDRDRDGIPNRGRSQPQSRKGLRRSRQGRHFQSHRRQRQACPTVGRARSGRRTRPQRRSPPLIGWGARYTGAPRSSSDLTIRTRRCDRPRPAASRPLPKAPARHRRACAACPRSWACASR